MFKFILSVLVLLLGSWEAANAFSLIGPVGNRTGFGGEDAWQQTRLGYDGGVNGPKRFGEGYRINAPVVFYGWDASFLSGFDTNHAPDAIEGAFALLNSLPNVSSFSSDLSEFPLESRQQNYLGYNLGLLDLKTEMFGALTEQIGLTDPERYVWTLHDRVTAVGESCPAGQLFTVVERNIDPKSFDQNSTVYSPYVNEALYTYEIIWSCTPDLAVTENYTLDPYADASAPVASFQSKLKFGDYFTGLTRDDAMGLQSLINSNNIVFEDAPAGSLQLVTNVEAAQQLSTTNYGVFLSQILTNDPVTLVGLFPGLEINYTATNFLPVIFTNISFFYTNLSVMPVSTNFIFGGLMLGEYFTNQPGQTIIDYDNVNEQGLQTLDLGAFTDLAATNSPDILVGLYPGLVITSTNKHIVFGYVTNYISYFTNKPGQPYTVPPITVTVPVSTNHIFLTNWLYTFGNLVTNHFYTNRLVITQSIYSTNLPGVPYYLSLKIVTNYSSAYIPRVSGDFFIIPTNWCGFDVTQVAGPNNPPYAFGLTNTIVFQGFTTNGPTGTTNAPGTNIFGEIQNIYSVYTNYAYVVDPGICEPALTIGTNYSTNVLTEYTYSFGNVITNSYSSSTIVTIITTNITPVNGGTAGEFATNVTISSLLTNWPSGDFFITPTNWCGFNILSTYFTNTIYVTNTFVVTNISSTGGNLGQFSETTISQYTNRTYLVNPLICSLAAPAAESRRGVEKIQYIRGDYDSDLGQFFIPITNTFVLTSIQTNQDVVKTYQRIITQPDLLISAADLVTLTGLGLGGPVNPVYQRTVEGFDEPAKTIAQGLAGPGTINLGQVITFNDGGPVLYHDNDRAALNGQSYFDGFSYTNLLFGAYRIWASYDGSTNLPVLYPANLSVANLAQQLLIEVNPQYLPDGTNGIPYSVNFSAVGGQPPYNWSLLAASQSALPNGLSLTGPSMSGSAVVGTNAVISGTPTGVIPGTYGFQLQLNDSNGRSVGLDYSITIH